MIHYSCDRCQRLIETEDEVRYVVRLDIEAKVGDAVFAEQDEEDHLMEIHDILERQDDERESLADDEVYQRNRFDLCSHCHKEYLRNPLGKEIAKTIDFSQN